MSNIDYDYLLDKNIELLARIIRKKEQEKKGYSSKKLSKLLSEVIIKTDAIPENEPYIYIEQRQYIDNAPKSLDETMARLAEADYKGMVPIDPDMYRLEKTGTTKEEIAKIVNELSKAEFSSSTDLEFQSKSNRKH